MFHFFIDEASLLAPVFMTTVYTKTSCLVTSTGKLA